MNRTLLFVVVFALVSLPAFAQEKKVSNGVEQAVLKLEQQWEDALLKSDVAALEKIYDDSLVYTHSTGGVDNKAVYVGNIKSGATKYESMKRDDIKVSVYGNTALVTCHWEVHVMARGNKIDTNARYIHVYVRQKDGWKMVAHQSTRIVQ
ncbi:MAG TPA: nuclear transport factor 2 family protein [Blastocatellia bacterium]|nr:nuclear transport factor 2 family protein [Blastocatellia bacterium]